MMDPTSCLRDIRSTSELTLPYRYLQVQLSGQKPQAHDWRIRCTSTQGIFSRHACSYWNLSLAGAANLCLLSTNGSFAVDAFLDRILNMAPLEHLSLLVLVTVPYQQSTSYIYNKYNRHTSQFLMLTCSHGYCRVSGNADVPPLPPMTSCTIMRSVS